MDAAEALEECEQEEENAAFDDGTKDAVQASAEYSDGKFTWVLDGNGTLTITGNNMELTKNEISESALEKAGIDFSRVNKLVIGNGITGFDRWGMWNLKKYIKELEIHGNAGMNMPEQCFYDVPNIESVVISGAVDVPRDMFGKCTELKKVTLKNGVRSIGEDAFRDCSSLESVIFENTVLEKSVTEHLGLQCAEFYCVTGFRNRNRKECIFRDRTQKYPASGKTDADRRRGIL